jgi:signal transduction histidine kinase
VTDVDHHAGMSRYIAPTCLIAGLTLMQSLPPYLLGFGELGLVLTMLLQALLLSITLTVVERWVQRRALWVRFAVWTAIAVLLALVTWTIQPVPHNLPPEVLRSDMALLIPNLVMNVIGTGMWVLTFVVPAIRENQRVRELALENLRLEAAELRTHAELVQLRSQLEPHFLLNTLNVIGALVSRDQRKARRALVCLGDLLRDALEDRADMHRIVDEAEWLERYIEVLQIRHGCMLRVEWFVEPAARMQVLPRLILQPLVENAVVHGALSRSTGGRIDIRISRAGTRLRCEVADDGPGLPDRPRVGAIGLDNVRRRLELLAPGATLELATNANGTTAVIDLPWGGA